ncbi:MAG: hypothetical protein LBB16_02275 [Puniceicoccales bacterium]|nr:hypothetical protein [Puniceicoccales bacterium]
MWKSLADKLCGESGPAVGEDSPHTLKFTSMILEQREVAITRTKSSLMRNYIWLRIRLVICLERVVK